MCLLVHTSEKYFSVFTYRKLSVEMTGKFVSFALKKTKQVKIHIWLC